MAKPGSRASPVFYRNAYSAVLILTSRSILVGLKVVSVSRTPGHTKHFQTIFLTRTVRLCDSPGLVFPSLVARPLQVCAVIADSLQITVLFSVLQEETGLQA